MDSHLKDIMGLCHFSPLETTVITCSNYISFIQTHHESSGTRCFSERTDVFSSTEGFLLPPAGSPDTRRSDHNAQKRRSSHSYPSTLFVRFVGSVRWYGSQPPSSCVFLLESGWRMLGSLVFHSKKELIPPYLGCISFIDGYRSWKQLPHSDPPKTRPGNTGTRQ